jgi:hypothetical protein
MQVATMTNNSSLVVRQKPQFPSLFAVWRPTLDRWQFCRPVRGADGAIITFRSVWRPFTTVEFGGARITGGKQTVLVRGRTIIYWQIGAFHVRELEDRGLVDRKIPAFEFGCWRSLPRPTI